MATLRIEFETDNAAFADDYPAQVNRLLASAGGHIMTAYHLGYREASYSLLDSNGNTVGKVMVSE